MAPSPDEKLNYIPLHLHSCYSIRDGLQNVDAIVNRAARLGFPALALTDFCNVAGFIRFYNACRAAGIKPIMGADLQLQDPCPRGDKPGRYCLTLLAMNRRGKQNLYDLLSEAWLNPGSTDIGEICSTPEQLARCAEGLMVLNGFRGDLASFARAGRHQELEARLKFYLKHFGDRFCLEITRTGRAGESEFERLALGLCLKYGIAPAASNDTRFLMGPDELPEDGLSDYTVHDVRVSIQKNIRRGSKELAAVYSEQQYLRSPAEMRRLFADLPEALENTRTIAVRCNVTLELDHPRLPRYDTGELSAADYLRREAHRGLESRLKFLFPDGAERERRRPEYEARLKNELKVIIDMDFAGYFLIVMEFIRWSRARGVPVGPGRGSGGGSLVAYALTITGFDPLRFDLLFERFLNPERVSMPDFDIDFCQMKRALTLRHVVEHYGRQAVSQIAAFGTLAPRAAIQSAGRALGIPHGKVKAISDLISGHHGVTFRGLLDQDQSGAPDGDAGPDERSRGSTAGFAAWWENAKDRHDHETVELVSLAIRLEGVIRNISTHAAGVVIAPTRIAEFSPVMRGSDGNIITQFDKDDAGHAGLVKFDFLGLTTLTIIDEALKMINARRARTGEKPLQVQDIPYADPDSFNTLQAGETTGVFQLESPGMRRLIRQMHPDCFDDLIALVALYRPGPLESGMVGHYVRRKHGLEPVCYPQPEFQDPDLKPVLESTYGVIVYQEQVMQLAQILAGYSLGSADILRRAMSKKIKSEMDAQRAVFLRGAEKKGKDPKVVMQIFGQMEKFAEYGFNKSHSVGYALIAWRTLWLKVHYPAEFLAATMTAKFQKAEDSPVDDSGQIAAPAAAPNKRSAAKRSTASLMPYIAECRRCGIRICPPDINTSRFEFTISPDGRSITCGLALIKGTGEKLTDKILEEREHSGPFRDFFDFVSRTGKGFVNKCSLGALIKSGALDKLGPGRAAMMQSIPAALKYAARKQTSRTAGMQDLFAEIADPLPDYPFCGEWSSRQQLAFEKEVLGMYVSGHPADAFRREMEHFCGDLTLAKLQPGPPLCPGQASIAGMVTKCESKTSKKSGQAYCLLTLEDGTAAFQTVLFGEQALRCQALAAQQEQTLRELQQRKHAQAGTAKLPGTTGKKGSMPPPPEFILILHGQLFHSADDQLKFQVSSLASLEELRLQQARTLTISLDSGRFEKLKTSLRELLQPYHLKPGTVPVPGRDSRDSRGSGETEYRGCTLKLRLDGRPQQLLSSDYRVLPADALICRLQDLAGSSAVIVGY